MDNWYRVLDNFVKGGEGWDERGNGLSGERRRG